MGVFALLERREELGGTWGFFKYPGFRTDSDMHTFGFSFRPWREKKQNGVEGHKVLSYLHEAAEEGGLKQHIRFGTHVVRASWSSERAQWQVECSDGKIFTAMVLLCCTGSSGQRSWTSRASVSS